MSNTVFFLDSTDRVYNDTELNALTDIALSDGVLNKTKPTRAAWRNDGDLRISAPSDDKTIVANTGWATVTVESNGKEQQAVVTADTQLTAAVTDNPTAGARNDAAVLRVNQTLIDNDNLNAGGDNAVELVIVSGSDAEPLTDVEINTALGGDPFVRLADILVPSTADEITESDLTDVRELAQMSKASQLASDTVIFNALPEDPRDLTPGEIWYNQKQDTLKIYNGQKIAAVTKQRFGAGFYPPEGKYRPVEVSTVYDNTDVDNKQSEFIYTADGSAGGPLTEMLMQIFEYPDINQPIFRIMTGRTFDNSEPRQLAPLEYRTYELNQNNEPTSEIERLGAFRVSELADFGLLRMYGDGDYQSGTKYGLVAMFDTSRGQYNTSTEVNNDNEYYGSLAETGFDSNDFFKNIRLGKTNNSVTNDATDITANGTWYSIQNGMQFVMSVSDADTELVGEKDEPGQNHRVYQSFVPRSEDVRGIRLVRGKKEGNPDSGNKVILRLYKADRYNEPTGAVLAETEIDDADYGTTIGNDIPFDIEYNEFNLSEKYVLEVDVQDYSDSDNYGFLFLPDAEGTAKRYNTNDGYTELGGDFAFGFDVTAAKKIITADKQGKVPEAILPQRPVRVDEYESKSEYAINVKDYGALQINNQDQTISEIDAGVGIYNMQEIIIRIDDNGNSQSINNWTGAFNGKYESLPGSTPGGSTLYLRFMYEESVSTWQLVDKKTGG